MQDSTSVVFSELELDALKELVNLGVSNAALSLREMAREEVSLSVPNLEIVTREQAIANLSEQAVKRLVGINQNFDGDIRGRALLIFPEAKSFELVRAIVGGNLSIEDIVELEQEALVETGNVLLNGCLSTIANQLGRSLKISLPELIYGGGSAFFAATPATSDTDRVLFVYINFAIRQRDLQGYIALLLDMPSMLTLQQLIGEFIERTVGGPASP